jgi:hypothetical protein
MITADMPAIFSAPMVRALLEGRKTMTRRLAWSEGKPKAIRGKAMTGYRRLSAWTRLQPGDRLWVRERINRVAGGSWQYEADKKPVELGRDNPRVSDMIAWAHHYERDYCPSIHMPRWASRITLIITATKNERVQDITEEDAKAEGVGEPYLGDGDPPFVERAIIVDRWHQFRNVWVHLHGRASWDANPEVVAPTFTVHLQNIDALKVAA